MRETVITDDNNQMEVNTCQDCPNGKYRLDVQSDINDKTLNGGPPACVSHCDFSHGCPVDCDTSNCPELGLGSKSYVNTILASGCDFENLPPPPLVVAISATKVSPDDTAQYPILLVTFQTTAEIWKDQSESQGGSHGLMSKIIVSDGSMSKFTRISSKAFTATVNPSNGATKACTINVQQFSFTGIDEKLYNVQRTLQFDCENVKQCHDCPAGVSVLTNKCFSSPP